MKKNMGAMDKVIRVCIAILIAVLYFTHSISGTAALISGIVAIVLALTSFISFCPLYLPFGINTRSKTR